MGLHILYTSRYGTDWIMNKIGLKKKVRDWPTVLMNGHDEWQYKSEKG